MAQDITLHGGPMHGKRMAIPDGQHLLHIKRPRNNMIEFKQVEDYDDMESIDTQTGQYSRVTARGVMTDDFEWDGWIG